MNAPESSRLQRFQQWLAWLSDRASEATSDINSLMKHWLWLSLMLFALTISVIIWNVHHRNLPVHYNFFLAIRFFQNILVGYFALMLRPRYPKTSNCVLALALFASTTYLSLFAVNIPLLSPFPLIQSKLLAFQEWLHLDQGFVVSWVFNHTYLHRFINWCYKGLIIQILLTLILLMLKQRTDQVLTWVYAVTLAIFIGFGIYYFIPAFPPVSVIHNSVHFPHGTELIIKRYYQLKHHMAHYTTAPGLIAFPSFHVILSWSCMIALRRYGYGISTLSVIYTLLLSSSTVLLGWHYLADVPAGIAVILLSYWVARRLAAASANKEAQKHLGSAHRS